MTNGGGVKKKKKRKIYYSTTKRKKNITIPQNEDMTPINRQKMTPATKKRPYKSHHFRRHLATKQVFHSFDYQYGGKKTPSFSM